MTPPERKYALIKVQAGDYLLPSNDHKTLWRIKSYQDGPSYGLDPASFPRDFWVWGVWRWAGDYPVAGTVDTDALENMDRWHMVSSSCRTRRAAIDTALDAG